jgi:hypothetical protein
MMMMMMIPEKKGNSMVNAQQIAQQIGRLGSLCEPSAYPYPTSKADSEVASTFTRELHDTRNGK